MYFKFRKQKERKISGRKSGVLKIEVPHWAAQVRIFNSLLQPETEIGKILEDSQSKSGYSLEAVLQPGIYQVQTSLEGKTESEWIPVNEGRVTEVSPKAWQGLQFTSASPIKDTDNYNKIHSDRAAEFSRKITWDRLPGGDSRLFLFVRTPNPKTYGGSFSEGLQLWNASGKLVTDFSEGIEKNKKHGWAAFNADLPSGGYVLRRGRRGVRLRHQIIYLCANWETQIFLNARLHPSLSTWSLNMAPRGKGFHPNDESVSAAEAITANLRYGSNSLFLLQNEKIKRSIDVLLDEKIENPWLGVLAAHAIFRLRERTENLEQQLENLRKRKSEEAVYFPEQLEKEIFEAQNYFAVLENKVKPFLQRAVGEHPDVRALFLSPDQPADKPFDFPPTLAAGIEKVQFHALRFADTIPLDSLTDYVVDNLVLNSPWTAWRHLSRPLKQILSPQSKKSQNKQQNKQSSATDFSVSAVLSQTAAPRTPVYYLADDEAAGSQRQQSSSETVLQDAPMIQKVKERVINYAKDFKVGKLLKPIKLNSAKIIDKVLLQVTPQEISENFGIPLARTEESLKILHSQAAGNFQSDDPAEDVSATVISLAEKSLVTVKQAILEYALSKFGKTESETSGAAQAVPKFTIREIVNKIQCEADRLGIFVEQGFGISAQTALDLATKMYGIAEALLKHADFVMITDARGKILYSNGTFLLLVSPKSGDRAEMSEKEISEARLAIQRNWEKVLGEAQIGLSEFENPYETIEWRKWKLSRTEIEDQAANRSVSYLNLMRLSGFPPLREDTLREINSTTANLSFYSPLLVYSSAESKTGTEKNLRETIERLELKLSEIDEKGEIKMEENRQPAENDESGESPETEEIVVTEETADDANEPTLYGKEFFNIERHNLITGTAVRLFSANTAARVRQILAPLDQVFDEQGGWADEIKKNAANRPQDAETQAFFADDRNKSHKQWHYVDIPLGANNYAEGAALGFTRGNDVVQTIKECVRVLQGESNRFSELNALRLLGHLVGDVHQPLHVACGFIDDRQNPPKFAKDPDIIRQHDFRSDTGGNAIALPGAGKLHSYWDSGLGGLIGEIELDSPLPSEAAASEAELKTQLIEKLYHIAAQDFAAAPSAGGEADASNDPSAAVVEWAEQWANESLLASREAYRTLKIVEQTASGFKVSWEGKAAYNERCAPLLRDRMALAARHLAQMLNAIYE